MRNIILGVIIGLILGTFYPSAASISRNLFDAGASATETLVEGSTEAIRGSKGNDNE